MALAPGRQMERRRLTPFLLLELRVDLGGGALLIIVKHDAEHLVGALLGELEASFVVLVSAPHIHQAMAAVAAPLPPNITAASPHPIWTQTLPLVLFFSKQGIGVLLHQVGQKYSSYIMIR